MELRHLLSFLAIADELHFGRAAAKLHLAQPSLSQQLQRLERHLGVELVARTSHEVRLTPAGRVFQAEARGILQQVARATHAAREAAAGRAGTINVGYNFPAGQQVIPAALAKMNVDHPNVVVSLWEKRTGPQLTALAAGDLDVALVYGRPASAEFECRQLLSVPLVALVGRQHPWAGRGRIQVRELAGQSCILFRREQSPGMYDAIVSAAARSGISLKISYQVDDPGATAIMVATKPVVGFCSALRGSHVCAMTGTVQPVALPLVDPRPTLGLYAVWRAAGRTPMVDAFLDCLDAAAPFGAAELVAQRDGAEDHDHGPAVLAP